MVGLELPLSRARQKNLCRASEKPLSRARQKNLRRAAKPNSDSSSNDNSSRKRIYRIHDFEIGFKINGNADNNPNLSYNSKGNIIMK